MVQVGRKGGLGAAARVRQAPILLRRIKEKWVVLPEPRAPAREQLDLVTSSITSPVFENGAGAAWPYRCPSPTSRSNRFIRMTEYAATKDMSGAFGRYSALLRLSKRLVKP